MAIDEQQHVALPKLYGAPAYTRPPASVPESPRPFDPDELPIEAFQTEEEREFSSTLPARAYAPGSIDLGGDGDEGSTTSTGVQPRPFRRRGIAGRLLGGG